MPMRYADQVTVLAALKIKDTDTAAIARVTEIENGIADTIDGLIGRSFGTTPTPETRTVAGLHTDVLVLTDGVRSVSGVAVGGTWDGVAWTGETVLEPDQWELWAIDRDGIAYGIQRRAAGLRLWGTSGLEWAGPVRVTAVWADQGGETVPADVREAVKRLTLQDYRRQTTGTTEIGPEGLAVSTPHAWNDPLVKAAIARHRVVPVVV